MDRSRILRLAFFLFIAAVYIAARLWNLTASCLWFDEIFSVHAAEHSWGSILNFVALDLIHPPFFYLILKLWIAIGGESLLWLRMLPVLFAVIAIVPFVFVCRELRLSYWTTMFAFFLISVNGSLIKYAQELRMYSMLMCLALFSMWLFSRYLRSGKGIVALCILNIVLAYTHYFGWLVILSEFVAVLFIQRARWRPVLVMAAISLLAFLPWLAAIAVATRSGSDLGQNIGWMQRPGLVGIGQFVLGLVEPFYYPATSVDAISDYRVSIPLLLITIVSIALYLAETKRDGSVEINSIYLLASFAVVPAIAAFVASWLLPYSVWGTRHLIIVIVPFAILLAASIAGSRYTLIHVAATVLVVLFSGYAFVIQLNKPMPNHVWCGFETLGEKVLPPEQLGPIYVFEDLAAYHLWFTFRTDPDYKMRRRVVKVEGFPGIDEDKAYFIPRGLDEEYLVRGRLPLNSDQMWIVYRAPNFDLTKPPLDTLLANGLKVERKEVFAGDEGKVFAVFLTKYSTQR